MRAAVVGHVEWVDFLRVDRLPEPGEIAHASGAWAAPAGGGPVAAVQLAKLAGGATLFTALGDDELGHRAHRELEAMGLQVEAVFRKAATRRAITHLDAGGERTITVLGDRLAPSAADPLPWGGLGDAGAVYVCAADPPAMRLARRARTLVVTSRIVDVVRDAAVRPDAVVGSALDPAETYRDDDLSPAPALVVRTEGPRGGTYSIAGGGPVRYEPATPPGPIADAYGCGDSFAAGLAYALGAGSSPAEAIAFAARCGAAVATGRGPYEAQLRSAPSSEAEAPDEGRDVRAG